jgi:hypothetical protein
MSWPPFRPIVALVCAFRWKDSNAIDTRAWLVFSGTVVFVHPPDATRMPHGSSSRSVGATQRLFNRANARILEEQQELDYLLHWPRGWMDGLTELSVGMALVITSIQA